MHLVGGDRFVIVLHEELQEALSRVALGEFRGYGYALVCVFHTVGIGSKLGKASSPVAVQLVSLRVDSRWATLQSF